MNEIDDELLLHLSYEASNRPLVGHDVKALQSRISASGPLT